MTRIMIVFIVFMNVAMNVALSQSSPTVNNAAANATDSQATEVKREVKTEPVAEPVAELIKNNDLNAPVRVQKFSVTQLASGLADKLVLRGVDGVKQFNFTVRKDEIVTQATLKLYITPSPSLIPEQSQLKVYLNEVLEFSVPVTDLKPGKVSTISIPLSTLNIKDFNTLEFEFVGNYVALCVNQANPILWMDIDKEKSELALTYQQLKLKNDLAYFPSPFLDLNDVRPLVIPMYFSQSPSLKQQQAAGILASWFGVKAAWRQKSYPVFYNKIPESHMIAFGTNDNMPEFIKNHEKVSGPVIKMMDHPTEAYNKVLLVLGRDDADLLTAVKGIAQGNLLFRGESMKINDVVQLNPRQPYDAPNWISTDRPMFFSELKEYANQLESTGRQPLPLSLNLNLPPDLFMIRSTGINIDLKFRYTSPVMQDQSRLVVRLNERFVQSFPLKSIENENKAVLHLPILGAFFDDKETLSIPALKLGASNQLQFQFLFASIVGSAKEGYCQTQLVPNQSAVIDDQSKIDFSGYRHYIEMPDLHAFILGGFPFSRMADFSDTLALIGKNPDESQLSLFLNILGNISAQTGYPALNVGVSNDWSLATEQDKDKNILLIGKIPSEFKGQDNGQESNKDANILIKETDGFIREPASKNRMLSSISDESLRLPDTQVTLSGEGMLATILGIQSPFNPQKSVIALLANDKDSFNLLIKNVNSYESKDLIFGMVSIIRESGISSLRIGNTYFVGYLPWWENIWHSLVDHPVLLAFLAVITALISTIMIWRILRALSHRRLPGQ